MSYFSPYFVASATVGLVRGCCGICWRLIAAVASALRQLIGALVVMPLATAGRVWVGLCLLPVNIPLRLVLGVSVQGLVARSPDFLNAYVLLTLLQYSIVLALFGIVLGSLVGCVMGYVHYSARIPDVYLDVSALLAQIKRRVLGAHARWANWLRDTVTSVVENIVGRLSRTNKDTAEKNVDETVSERTLTPVSVHRKVTIETPPRTPPRTPPHTPTHTSPQVQDSPGNEDTTADMSDLEILFDRYDTFTSDSALPRTVRTGQTTMRTTRTSMRKQRPHEDSSDA